MTKTLTEQWREGTLPDGHYYVQYDKCSPFIKDSYGMMELIRCLDSEKIEVLASVPTYAEFMDLMSNIEYIDKYRELLNKTEQLEKKLAIATKALKKIDPPNIIFDDYRNSGIDLWEIAHNALKEMEGVK